MVSRAATFPAFGIDTVQVLDAEACRFLVKEGYLFAVRYLGGIKKEELDRILCSGLAMMPVTYSRKAGWTPSGSLGKADGEKSVRQLSDLSMSKGCTAWLDLEGCAGPKEQTEAWINAWASEIKSAGYMPGLYVGAGTGGLDGTDLYKLPNIKRYWRSCSMVPDPLPRSWSMMQLYPPNIKLGPMIVDVDVVCKDWKNDIPWWVVD